MKIKINYSSNANMHVKNLSIFLGSTRVYTSTIERAKRHALPMTNSKALLTLDPEDVLSLISRRLEIVIPRPYRETTIELPLKEKHQPMMAAFFGYKSTREKLNNLFFSNDRNVRRPLTKSEIASMEKLREIGENEDRTTQWVKSSKIVYAIFGGCTIQCRVLVDDQIAALEAVGGDYPVFIISSRDLQGARTVDLDVIPRKKFRRNNPGKMAFVKTMANKTPPGNRRS